MKAKLPFNIFKFSRFILGLILITTLIWLTCDNSTGQPDFRFVFMTDIHVQPERDAAAGFRAAIARVNQIKPDFVITGGDLIMDALGQSYQRADSLYTLFIEICKEFQMPVYHVLGNHEVFGLYEKSGIQPDHPQYGKVMFKQRLGEGKTYFSFNHEGWHFILLDAVEFTPERRYIGGVDSTQLEWLKNDLTTVDKTTPIAVALHIPLVSVYEQMKNGATAAFSPGSVVKNSTDVLAAFEDYALKLVLQGHLHILEEIIYHDVHYITGGAVSGAWWQGARHGFPEGFVVVDVKGDDFSWNYETFGWQAQP